MNIVKPVCKFFAKNGPLILSLTASAGVVATAVLTGKAVLKADEILEGIPEDKLKSKKTKVEIAKVYIWPVVAGAGTIACIIGAHCLNAHINAGLIAAYGLLSTQFAKYRDEIEPDIDTYAMNLVRKDITEVYIPEMLEKKPNFEGEVKLWRDDYHQHPYWAREADIWKGLHNLNKEIFEPTMHPGFATVDKFYGMMPWIESEPQDSVLGWSVDYTTEEWDCYLLEVNWVDDGTYTDPNGYEIKCNYLVFNIPPVLNFFDFNGYGNVEPKYFTK